MAKVNIVLGMQSPPPFEAIEAALRTTATSAQHTKVYTLSRACMLAEGETVDIYSDSHYVFGGTS